MVAGSVRRIAQGASRLFGAIVFRTSGFKVMLVGLTVSMVSSGRNLAMLGIIVTVYYNQNAET